MRRQKLLVKITLYAIALFGALGHLHAITSNELDQDKKTALASTDLELTERLQNLFDAHGRLLNQLIVSNTQNATTNVIKTEKNNLLRNAREISQVFIRNTSPQAGKQFEALLFDHIQLNTDYINAVKAKNQNLADLVIKKAIANGRKMAVLLNQLYPTLNVQEMQNIIDEHIVIDTQQIDAYFQGNVAKGTVLRDRSLNQLKELASIIDKGMVAQKEKE